MVKALRRNGVLLGGMVLCGLLCLMARPSLMAHHRGSFGPSVLHAESVASATLALVLSIGAATLVACVVARLLNAVCGLFTLGAGLFVLTSRLASVQDLVLNGGSLGRLAVETLLLAALLFVATVIVFLAGGPLPDVHPPEEGTYRDPESGTASRLVRGGGVSVFISMLTRFAMKGQGTGRTHHPFGVNALIGASTGAIMLPVIWIFAKSTMKGQMVGAAFVGAMLAGLFGRLLRPHVQPVLLFVSPLVFGAIGYVVAMMLIKEPLDAAFVGGTLNPLARPMPLDYAAGTLTGVAVGLGWARSFLVHHPEEPSGRPATAH